MREWISRKKKVIYKWHIDCFTIDGDYNKCVLTDKFYLKKIYWKRMGKKLNLRKPQSFTEKQNWLKLYDRNPKYHIMADKYAARDYVAEKIGGGYLVPLLGVWESPEDIDFESLPDKFVLKCNHDNGVIICTDKSKLDIEETKKQLYAHLNRDWYKKLREWTYKDIPRKIICEKYMENTIDCFGEGYECKFYCFDGVPRSVVYIRDRFQNKRMDTYTINWEWLPIQQGEVTYTGYAVQKPKQYEVMKELAERLSKGIPFVRVDFNVWNEAIYFGEFTFYDTGGFEQYHSIPGYAEKDWDLELGKWLILPRNLKSDDY